MSDDDLKRPTHVQARHGTQRRLPVLGALSLPSDWDMKDGVPRTRAECADGERPCRYVSCRQHLWLVLQQDRPGNPSTGSQGETTLRPIGDSCALDVADRGAHTIDEVGEILGVTGTRANQIELSALRKLRAAGVTLEDLLALLDDAHAEAA